MKLKKILSMFISTIVFASISTNTVFASTANIQKETKINSVMTDEQEKISKEFLSKYPNLKDAYISKLETNEIQTLTGSAPKLSDYFIYFVADSKSGTNYTGESITKNQKVTKSDHNGTIYVLTEEIGYGGESTTFNNQNVKKYDSVTLDFNGDKIVDGFTDIWKIDNVTNGDFSSISISTNGTGIFKTVLNIL